MPSYYNHIDGTLQPGRTARSSDIHLIQSSIQDAFQRALIDICGTGVVLGDEENALRLSPTTQHVDQSNSFDFADEENPGLSFYEIYLRQPIDIEKSSIERVRLQINNNSNIKVTLYAEIRDADFDLVDETNAILSPTDINEYVDIDFIFNLNHLPLGRYYFVLRPVDISSIDLTQNGDESEYDIITKDMFKVKFDKEGHYSNSEYDYDDNILDTDIIYEKNSGLYASYNGTDYLEARLLDDYLLYINNSENNEPSETNFDLCFECIFSSNNTYVISNGSAIVLGEKVYPLDTHVTIDGPSIHGDRTDLVILTADGQLHVIKGTVYNGERQYPVDNTGLKIAYITTYQYGISEDEKQAILNGNETVAELEQRITNQKVPSIEQDDENDMTRRRDILERLRRLEKKVSYQNENNSPTRIKYYITTDPILFNNGVADPEKIKGEGTYGVTSTTNANGDNIVSFNNRSQTYSWAIIEDNYSYQYTVTNTDNGILKVFDVHMPLSKPSGSIQSFMKCEIRLTSHGQGVPYAKLKVVVKKDSKTITTYNIQTNNDGIYNLALWGIKNLKTGNYKIYVTYNNKTVKTNMVVYPDNYSFKNITRKSSQSYVSVKTATAAETTHSLPDTVIPGNDSFYLDKMELDEDKGEVRIQTIKSEDDYEKNKLLKDMKVFSSNDTIYKLKSDKIALTSEYPILNFTLSSDTNIKTITPYISGFKNIDKFGILIFKNDFIFDANTNTRKLVQKKISKKDTIFPTVYNSGWQSLSNLSKDKDGYKKPKKPISFDVKKDFDAGTYSLVVYGHIQKGQTEGMIKIKEYITRDYKKEYGIATKCIGSSKPSIINMDMNNLTNKSWDVLIEQKPYKYYNTGILISKSIQSSYKITGCTIRSNMTVPNGCKVNIYVSNNGGSSWVNANSKEAHFKGNGYNFRWKLEMISNSTQTPILSYNEKWKYAISFKLSEESTYVEYEDFQKCYETPLINANSITRQYTGDMAVAHRFSEWEFARIFMEDEGLKSKIDILISFAEDAYTSGNTNKSNWSKDIFFSRIFADLTLNDFSRDSVDYDNYNGKVEYDEYNYRFKLDTEEVTPVSGQEIIASPDTWHDYNDDHESPYYYGDISEDKKMLSIFNYHYEDKVYEYVDNVDEEYDDTIGSPHRYSGMHVVDGPRLKATLEQSEKYSNCDDIIVGISFNRIVEASDTITHFTIGIVPEFSVQNDTTTNNNNDSVQNDTNTNNNDDTNDNTPDDVVIDFEPSPNEKYIDANMLEVVIGINQHGDVDNDDATTGKIYPITQKLYANQYNTIDISFLDDLEGFSSSGIGSIGIRIKDNGENTYQMNPGDSIGLGRISTGSYNKRPYAPFTYTGNYTRFTWQSIKNTTCEAYAMCRAKDPNNYQRWLFYPIKNYDKNAYSATIKFPKNNTKGQVTAKYSNSSTNKTFKINASEVNHFAGGGNLSPVNLNVYGTYGTAYRETENNIDYGHTETIQRRATEISARVWYNSIGKYHTFVNKDDAGNKTLFYMPENITGELFKLNIDIPYTIYDLIDIRYSIFTKYQNNSDQTKDTLDDNVTYHDGYEFVTLGSFSKGDIIINLYDTNDTNASPVESFALPAWGRIQTNSTVKNKIVSAFFKKRSQAKTIKAITIERKNPRASEGVKPRDLYFVLHDIQFYNAKTEAALGPQMQIRIYPDTSDAIGRNTTIRRIGGIYRL